MEKRSDTAGVEEQSLIENKEGYEKEYTQVKGKVRYPGESKEMCILLLLMLLMYFFSFGLFPVCLFLRYFWLEIFYAKTSII